MASKIRSRFRAIASQSVIGRPSSRITRSFNRRLPGVCPFQSHSKMIKYPANITKNDQDHDRDRPFRHLAKEIDRKISAVPATRDADKDPRDQKDQKILNCMVDRNRQKTVADRSQRKSERHPFGRFDDQGFFGFDDLTGHLFDEYSPYYQGIRRFLQNDFNACQSCFGFSILKIGNFACLRRLF